LYKFTTITKSFQFSLGIFIKRLLNENEDSVSILKTAIPRRKKTAFTQCASAPQFMAASQLSPPFL